MVAITQHGYVAVAVDGWEDHQKRQTICFTVCLPTGRPYLFKFDRVDEETGELLNNKIMEVVDELSDMGVVVTGAVADNAANIPLSTGWSGRGQPRFWPHFQLSIGPTQPSAAIGGKKQPKKWLHGAAIWLHTCGQYVLLCSQ